MSAAVVSRVHADSAGSAGNIATAAQAHTTGNLLVVLVQYQAPGVNATITDTAGNTWVQAGARQVDSVPLNRGEFWYAYNATGHASNVVTATFDASSAYPGITVYEISGLGASNSFLDQSGANASSGTALNSTSVTVSVSDSIILAIGECDGGTLTAGSGYTHTAWNTYFADAYKLVTTSEAATMTAGASAPWYITGAAFGIAAAGGITYARLEHASERGAFRGMNLGGR